MKRKVVGIFVCMLLIGTILSSVSGTGLKQYTSISTLNDGNTLYVGGNGPGNYSTIQEAIDDSENGDTVYVYDDSSPYYENVDVGKEIYLIGEDVSTTVIDGMNVSDVVAVSANNVSINGFTIRNGSTGVLIWSNSEGHTISGNIITENYNWGIGITGFSENIKVTGNHIENNGHEVANTTLGASGGIYLAIAAEIMIYNNNFIKNKGQQAFFFKSFLNLWLRNYWDRPRLLPYPIIGLQAIIPPIFWLNFDWRPRITPYEIP